MATKPMLHKSTVLYDFSNPTYACGEPKQSHPNMTDAQAMALQTCPKCFPNGFSAAKVVGITKKQVEKGVLF